MINTNNKINIEINISIIKLIFLTSLIFQWIYRLRLNQVVAVSG